jgi:hypothetical protein
MGWMWLLDGWIEFFLIVDGRLTKTVRVGVALLGKGKGIWYTFCGFSFFVGLRPLFSNFGSKPVDVSATIRCQAFAPGRKNQSKKGRGQGACETRAYRYDVMGMRYLTVHQDP